MMLQRRGIVVGEVEQLRQRLRALVRQAGEGAAAEGRRWSMAIPGGSVVTQLLSAMRPDDAPWNGCDLFWVDERAVPWAAPDSNYALARAQWLDALAHTAMRLHPIPVDAPTLQACAAAYEGTLASVLGAQAILDLVIVGVGEDGHVASLFPGDEGALASPRLAIPVPCAPKPPPRRISLTLRTLTGARRVVVAAFGASKALAMRAALHEGKWELPITRLLRDAARVDVLLDRAAAGED
ncbi:MAG: 6-phosphogluconolactonase [Gemmatimonadaceae bacterium]|nr:6-phosphogluconolactonase [Gemmatimonadaceae bacterium]